MSKMTKMNLRAKLMLSVLIISIIILIIGMTGISKVYYTSEKGEEIYYDCLIPSNYLLGMTQQLTSIHSYYLHVAYGGKAAQVSEAEAMVDFLDKIVATYEKKELPENVSMLLAKVKDEFKEYNALVIEQLDRAEKNHTLISDAEITQTIEKAEKVQNALNAVVEYNSKHAEENLVANQKQIRREILTLIPLILTTCIGSYLIMRRIINGITTRLRSVLDAVEQVANGKLDVVLDTTYEDEIGQLSIHVAHMIGQLKEVILNIDSAAEQVHMGAKQVANTSSYLAQGATEQASSIEELSAAVEQINVQIKQNAEHASEMNGITNETKGLVTKSHEEMQQMLKAMEEINYSSTEVSKIIKVIDDIAFQTNILALNAAVEAARAGQHGKGFTVVAEEVRNLAARSAVAAKETTNMIEDSIKKAQTGMVLAENTAKELNHVVESINKVAVLTEEIFNSCDEQTQGIEQINEGTLQISNIIQSNSATSQEAAAASEELAGQAEVMRGEVSKFEMNRGPQLQYAVTKRKEAYHLGDQDDEENGFGKYA